MRNTVIRVALALLLSSILAIQATGSSVRAESTELPSSWTVEAYGNSTQFLIPRSINNNGVATAQVQTTDGFFPVELSDGQIITLGDGTVEGNPAAINDEGVIVGSIPNADGSTSAAEFEPGATTELNVGAAYDIDNSGTIVGSVDGVAAYWPQGGAPLALPSLVEGGWAQVLAMNEIGWMVGVAARSNGEGMSTNVVLWRDGQIADQLYTPEDPNADLAAVDVNGAGTIIGRVAKTNSDGTVGYSPFYWANSRIIPLPLADGDTSCEVYAINNSGWIAGDCGIGEEQHAVLWVHGDIVEVDTLLGDGWKSVVATDINDKGQIIGQGFRDGIVVTLVLTPAE